MVSQIRDTDERAKRQTAMRAGHGVHVVGFAVGGRQALKVAAIPGSATELKPMPASFQIARGCLSCCGLHCGDVGLRRGGGRASNSPARQAEGASEQEDADDKKS
jgi:hypothetical protein